MALNVCGRDQASVYSPKMDGDTSLTTSPKYRFCVKRPGAASPSKRGPLKRKQPSCRPCARTGDGGKCGRTLFLLLTVLKQVKAISKRLEEDRKMCRETKKDIKDIKAKLADRGARSHRYKFKGSTSIGCMQIAADGTNHMIVHPPTPSTTREREREDFSPKPDSKDTCSSSPATSMCSATDGPHTESLRPICNRGSSDILPCVLRDESDHGSCYGDIDRAVLQCDQLSRVCNDKGGEEVDDRGEMRGCHWGQASSDAAAAAAVANGECHGNGRNSINHYDGTYSHQTHHKYQSVLGMISFRSDVGDYEDDQDCQNSIGQNYTDAVSSSCNDLQVGVNNFLDTDQRTAVVFERSDSSSTSSCSDEDNENSEAHGVGNREAHGAGNREAHGAGNREVNGAGNREAHGAGNREAHGAGNREAHGAGNSEARAAGFTPLGQGVAVGIDPVVNKRRDSVVAEASEGLLTSDNDINPELVSGLDVPGKESDLPISAGCETDADLKMDFGDASNIGCQKSVRNESDGGQKVRLSLRGCKPFSRLDLSFDSLGTGSGFSQVTDTSDDPASPGSGPDGTSSRSQESLSGVMPGSMQVDDA